MSIRSGTHACGVLHSLLTLGSNDSEAAVSFLSALSMVIAQEALPTLKDGNVNLCTFVVMKRLAESLFAFMQ